MSKFRNAYEKSVDWILGQWFKAWLWQMKRLGIAGWASQETLDRINAELSKLYDTVDELQAENDTLRGQLAVAEVEQSFSEKPLTGPNRPNNNKKLTEREISDIRYFHRTGWTNKAIADTYDVNPATISRIVRGQYHKAVAA